MQWIVIGILIAIGISIGVLLIGILQTIWPFLLISVVLLIGGVIIYHGWKLIIDKTKDWPTIKFVKKYLFLLIIGSWVGFMAIYFLLVNIEERFPELNDIEFNKDEVNKNTPWWLAPR